MKKNLLKLLMVVFTACALSCALIACELQPIVSSSESSVDNSVVIDESTSEFTSSECTHEWQEATCLNASVCLICGIEEGDPLGHVEVFDEEIPATCLQNGLTEGSHCSVCGDVIIAQEVIEAPGHVEVIDARVEVVGCLQNGLTEGSHCSVCGDVIIAQEVIEAPGHSSVEDEAVNATCTQTGLTLGFHCEACGVILIPQEVIPMVEHSFNEDSKCVSCGYQREYKRDGNTVYFGTYPQTLVTDSSLISGLNNYSDKVPGEKYHSWYSYDYYVEDATTDIVWYKDVTFNGEKYRGVYITDYRPYWTYAPLGKEYSFQDDNGYNLNTAYWFKYEPIAWTIISESNGKATLLANLVIDSQAFQTASFTENGKYDKTTGKYYYASNYCFSTIKNWLNNTFYKKAFTTAEQSLIATTVVDNSARSTGDTKNPYGWNSIEQNVYLLSHLEAKNLGGDETRIKLPTDYALSQGVQVYRDTETAEVLSAYWYLRSPAFYNDIEYRGRERSLVHYIYNDGRIIQGESVKSACMGIVPAITLILE